MKMLFVSLSCFISLAFLLPSCVSPVPSEDAGASTGSQASSSGGSGSGGTVAGSGGNPGGCIGLDEAECNANDVCRPIIGGLITPNEDPSQIHPGTEAYLGCRYSGPRDNEIWCGSAIVCGYDPGGSDCWTFSNTCIPNGWTLMNCWDEQCPFLPGGAGGAD